MGVCHADDTYVVYFSITKVLLINWLKLVHIIYYLKLLDCKIKN